MATVYEINKGVNRSIEFKGIKAQYIIYLAVGLVLLLMLFAILYACGLRLYYCLGIVVPAAVGLIIGVQRLSRTYGEHGLQKAMAARQLPKYVRTRTRRSFIDLKQDSHAKE